MEMEEKNKEWEVKKQRKGKMMEGMKRDGEEINE